MMTIVIIIYIMIVFVIGGYQIPEVKHGVIDGFSTAIKLITASHRYRKDLHFRSEVDLRWAKFPKLKGLEFIGAMLFGIVVLITAVVVTLSILAICTGVVMLIFWSGYSVII